MGQAIPVWGGVDPSTVGGCPLANREYLGIGSVADSVLLLVSGFLGPGITSGALHRSASKQEITVGNPGTFTAAWVWLGVDTNGERLAETV